jgi:hypothetical protein
MLSTCSDDIAPQAVVADVGTALTYAHGEASEQAAGDTHAQSKVAQKATRPQSAGPDSYAHALGGIQRPKSARAASSNMLKMWAKTSHERSLQEKQDALRLFSKDLKETMRDRQYDGQLRREAAEASQRSRRHSLSGDPWRSGGACAGTVRSASLSRTHGSTTSGLFSDFQPLEGSESGACLRERIAEKRRPDAGKRRREEAEALRRSRAHCETGQPWRIGGACAGTVRSASLSRSHGSTISGLFSDVQPLAGSESAANLAEKARQREQRRSHQQTSSESGRGRELGCGVARSMSVPSLPLARRSLGSASSDVPQDSGREMCCSESSEADSDMQGLCAGSALAKVRSARRNSLGRRSACGGA